MGLTANELSPPLQGGTGGSNPLASAAADSSATTTEDRTAPVAQRIEHLTTDQKVRGGSNPSGALSSQAATPDISTLTPVAQAGFIHRNISRPSWRRRWRVYPLAVGAAEAENRDADAVVVTAVRVRIAVAIAAAAPPGVQPPLPPPPQSAPPEGAANAIPAAESTAATTAMTIFFFIFSLLSAR